MFAKILTTSIFNSFWFFLFLSLVALHAKIAPQKAVENRKEESVFLIDGKGVSLEELQKKNEMKFYQSKLDLYNQIKEQAEKAYLKYFWKEKAKEYKLKNIQEASQKYFKKNIHVSEKQVKEFLQIAANDLQDRFRFNGLSEKQKRERILKMLYSLSQRQLIEEIIASGIKKKKLIIKYPRPEFPILDTDIIISEIPYSSREDCPIILTVYDDNSCPYCRKFLEAVEKTMALKDKKGELKWKKKVCFIVRDFPLDFHKQARISSIATKCAAEQSKKKYFALYKKILRNQEAIMSAREAARGSKNKFEMERRIHKDKLSEYAKSLSLDMKKWKACLDHPPQKILDTIEKNIESANALRVRGTPAPFVNGIKFEGGLSSERLDAVFEEEWERWMKKYKDTEIGKKWFKKYNNNQETVRKWTL